MESYSTGPENISSSHKPESTELETKRNLDAILRKVKAGAYEHVSAYSLPLHLSQLLNDSLKEYGLFYKGYLPEGIIYEAKLGDRFYFMGGGSDKIEDEYKSLSKLYQADPKHFVKPYSLVDNYGYIMEFAEGKKLADYIRFHRKSLMSQTGEYEKIYRILNELVDTTLRIHKCGFYHGDLRPYNIIINPNNKLFKIIDPYPRYENKMGKINDLFELRLMINAFLPSIKSDRKHYDENAPSDYNMQKLSKRVEDHITAYNYELFK